MPVLSFLFPRRLMIGKLYSHIWFIIFCFVVVALTIRTICYKIKYNKIPIIIYAAVFIGIMFLRLEIKQVIQFGTEFVLLTLLVLNVTNSIEDVKKMLIYIRNIATLLSVFGIVESFTKVNVFDIITRTAVVYEGANALRFGMARCRGSFTTSINFAMFLVICLAIDYYVITWKDRKSENIIITTALHIVALLCTVSRFPIIIAVIMSLIFGIRCGVLKVLSKSFAYILVLLIGYIGFTYIGGNKTINNFINGMWTLFLAVFSDDAAMALNGIVGNANGIGQRLKLFEWIWGAVEGKALLGLGWRAAFSQELYNTTGEYVVRIKDSIENHYLYLLYHTGFLGLFAFVNYMIGGIRISIKNRKKQFDYEGKLKYNFFLPVCIICYAIMIFSCGGFDDIRLFYILITLGIVYNRELKEYY